MNSLPVSEAAIVPPLDDIREPEREPANVLSYGQVSQLDICRCPKCGGPLTARSGPRGPYFHCRCSGFKDFSATSSFFNQNALGILG
jgi:hypothetical protein